MGIDIYAKWEGQTEAEKEAQYTGFDTTAGRVGYLREAYHGGQYVTQFLVKEAFDSETGKAAIPAAVLRERLPEAIKLAIKRAKEVYKQTATEDSPVVRSFTDFVELCEEQERRTGKPVTIIASY